MKGVIIGLIKDSIAIVDVRLGKSLNQCTDESLWNSVRLAALFTFVDIIFIGALHRLNWYHG